MTTGPSGSNTPPMPTEERHPSLYSDAELVRRSDVTALEAWGSLGWNHAAAFADQVKDLQAKVRELEAAMDAQCREIYGAWDERVALKDKLAVSINRAEDAEKQVAQREEYMSEMEAVFADIGAIFQGPDDDDPTPSELRLAILTALEPDRTRVDQRIMELEAKLDHSVTESQVMAMLLDSTKAKLEGQGRREALLREKLTDCESALHLAEAKMEEAERTARIQANHAGDVEKDNLRLEAQAAALAEALETVLAVNTPFFSQDVHAKNAIATKALQTYREGR